MLFFKFKPEPIIVQTSLFIPPVKFIHLKASNLILFVVYTTKTIRLNEESGLSVRK